jgi:hypothetical protein
MNQLPTTWLGILGLLIVTVPATLAGISAMITARRNRKKLSTVQSSIKTTQTGIDNINEQVTNNHNTNLRDDLTEVLRMTGITKDAVEKLQDNDIRLIRGDISRISDDISVLRGELTDERDARTDLEHRFDDREHRQHPPGEGP